MDIRHGRRHQKQVITWMLTLVMVLSMSLPIMGTTAYAKEQANPWQAGTEYSVGDMVTHGGGLYECRQAHRSIGPWAPDKALALWLPIEGDVPDQGGDTGGTNPVPPDNGSENQGSDITWEVTSDWGSGLVGKVTITNSGSTAIEDWNVTFKLPGAKVSSLWNAHYSKSGDIITVNNAGWNGTIRPGESKSFGMTLSYTGSFQKPTDMTLNGTPVEPGNGGNNGGDNGGNNGGDNGGNNGGQVEEYATVTVNVARPAFDTSLFTPSISVDGQSKEIALGGSASFQVKAGTSLQVSANQVMMGDKVYKPIISEGSFTLEKDEEKAITVTYTEEDYVPVDNNYVGYFQSWSDKWASKGADTHLANLPKYVNVVMLAFVKPDMSYNGNLNLRGTGLEFSYDGKVLKEAIEHLKSNNPDTKVILSIGGLTYTNWAGMNYDALARFVKDFGLDGVDLDYEPAGGFNTSYDANGKITYAGADEFVTLINKTREALPRPYLLCATAWSVGAYGEDQWKNAKPGPFASTGMMLPIFRRAGDKLDMVNVMGYNAGPYDPIDALKAYKNYFDGPVNMGVMVPPEDWGGHVWTADKVVETAKYVNDHNVGGMMIWSLQRTHANPSLGKPDAQMMSTLIAQQLKLPEANKSLFPLSGSATYNPPWGNDYPVPGGNDGDQTGGNNGGSDNGNDNGGSTPTDGDVAVNYNGLVVSGVHVSDTGSNFSTDFTVENKNLVYTWDGSMFNLWGFTFKTTSTVKSITGAESFRQEGDTVTVNLHPYETVIGMGEARQITVNFAKQGNNPYPTDITYNLMRGKDIYPTRPSLPSSFAKGKSSLTAGDLIKNQSAYYKEGVSPITDGLILYNSPSDTQINIGLADNVYTNLTNGIKMWVPSKYAAMALGFAQEVYGINPNYMAALGTKENFAFGVYPTVEGAFNYPVEINGKTWYWGMTSGSIDGPFQQETPNFNEVKDFFPDSFPENAQHDDYTFVQSVDDKKFIKATMASAASLTMTREYMYAVPSFEFDDFVTNAKDPSAEDVLLTYIYNRGLYSVKANVFKEDRVANMNSTNLVETLGYNGFADHVPQVLGIMEAMNKEVNDIYDIKLTKADVNLFLDEMRSFYSHGVPTDAQWQAMKQDVSKAFDVLAGHWNDNTVSFRYDFLTLVRVIKAHLPSTIPPSPKGLNYGYQVMNRN